MGIKANQGIVLLLLFLTSCSTTTSSDEKSPQTPLFTNIFTIFKSPDMMSQQELYQFPAWLDGCDRFRPLFEAELEEYPQLQEVLGLSGVYSLVYQETLCQTREELKEYYQNSRLSAD